MDVDDAAAPTALIIQKQVSGTSIVWALATIVFACMLQPSYSGYFTYGQGYNFREAFWLYRCFPGFCLIDSVADLSMIVSKGLKSRETDDSHLPRPAEVVTRLTIFILTVLPQAIKLFSMTGIPRTQALAAVFVVANLSSTIRSLCTNEPVKDIEELWDATEKSAFGDLIKIMSECFGKGSHIVLLICIWHNMALQLQVFNISDESWAIWTYVKSAFLLVSGVYLLQHTVFRLRRQTSPLPHIPLLFYSLLCPEDVFVENSKNGVTHSRGSVETFQAVASVFISSCIASYLIHFVTLKLLEWTGNTRPIEDQTSNTPSIEEAANVDSAEHETRIEDSAAGSTQPTALAAPPPVYLMPQQAVDRDGRHRQTQTSNDATPRTSISAMFPNASSDEEVGRFGKIRVSLFLVILIVLKYTGLLDIIDRIARGDEIDRGDSGPPEFTLDEWFVQKYDVFSQPSRRLRIQQYLWNTIIETYRLFERYVIGLSIRLPIEFVREYDYSLSYLLGKMKQLSRETISTAFVIFTFSTVAIYYTIVFDGKGTSSPHWMGFLG